MQPNPTGPSENRQRDDLPPGMGGSQSRMDQPPGMRNDGPLPYRTQPQVQVGTMNVKAYGGMALGLLLVVIGIGATMHSYSSPDPDGRYTIWYGPMLVGAIVFFGGVAGLFKK
jgi:hypothetical protein